MKNIGYKHIAIKLESCGSKVIKFNENINYWC